MLLGAGDSFDGPANLMLQEGWTAMPSCLSGVHAGQDSRNKFIPQIRGGGGVPEPHSFHLGLTLSLAQGPQGWKGLLRRREDNFFPPGKHQLFVLWPPISMLLFGGKVYKV